MTKESSWRKTSRRKLKQIMLEHGARLEAETHYQWAKRLKKAIADGYPFAQRSGFAYQCWLSERRKLLADLGLAEPPPKPSAQTKRSHVQQASLDGQLSMFELAPVPAGHGKDPTRIQPPLTLELEP